MTSRRTNRRGIALLLVVAVLALSAALSWVMLSSATLQTRAGANEYRLATADYLAESGLNLAMYYLQHSDRAPLLNSSGYWAGTGGDLTISSSIPGTVNVTVTQDPSDAWSYEIVCVAKAGINHDTQVTKTTGARVYVRNEYQVKHAALFNNDAVVMPYMTVVGDVWSSKKLSIKTSGGPAASISGTGYCNTHQTGVGYTNPTGGWKSVPASGWPAPSGTNDLNMYTTYSISDVPYSCSIIGGTSLGSVTYNPTTSNPAGVIYKDASSGGAFTLNSNVTINGTLVVKGDLNLSGANVVINAQPNFPALIVTGTLTLYQPDNSLTVNGICYVGNTVKTSGSVPSLQSDYTRFTINGALLGGTPSTTPINSTYTAYTTMTYNASMAKAPTLTSVQHVATGVSIVRWGLP